MTKLEKALQPLSTLPAYELASSEAIETIHKASQEILQEVGMAFYDQDAKALLASKGAKVEGDMVYFGSEMVKEFIAKAPSEFTQISRNPKRATTVGGDQITFAPVYGPPFVYDLENGRRQATLEDFKNFVKLTYLSPFIHHSGGTVVEPNDLPTETRHLDMLLAHIAFSDKPFMGSVTSPGNAQDSVEIVKILFGEDAITKNPALLSLINVNSPRQFDGGMLGALRVYAQAGQAIIITPFILAGTMSPVGIAGAIAQQNAEVLAGIVYAQALNPGVPVVYGSFLTTVDLKSGTPVFGSPESQSAIFTSAQLARKYGLPFRGGGMFTSSKLTDIQAGYESVMTMLPTVLGKVNFVLHAAGWLENGMTAGYEKFILDCDILGMFHKLMGGLDISSEGMAMDAIRAVSPGEHYLETDHTMRNFRTAFFRAELLDYTDYDQWELMGKQDTVGRANQRVKGLLDSYQAPSLDAAKKADLEAFISKRRQELLSQG